MGDQTEDKASRERKTPALSSFDAIRSLLLIALAGSVTLLDSALALSRTAWALSIGAIGLLVVIALMVRAWGLAGSNSLGHLHELFAYLVVSLIAGSALLYLDQMETVAPWLDLRLREPTIDWVAMSVAGGLFLLSFMPLVLAVIRIERRRKAESRRGQYVQPVLRGDIVSAPTFVITSLVLASICALAWAAGSGKFQLGQQINVLTMSVVVGGFLAVIFIPNMVRAWNDWIERRTASSDQLAANGIAALPLGILALAARLVSYFDSILVRIFAPLSGATQKGFMVPHLLVVLVIVPLSAMGFILAPPFGLLPIALAALIALALGRRWAWVEDDRETASRLQSTDATKADIKVGFDNDLKDEALLGYASLFVLVPLALYQIQGAMDLFVKDDNLSTGNAFLDWLSFFGAELAKAVPFVDWWEIYNVDVDVPYKATDGAAGEWARHLTFGARAVVDLVIMAALFQALTIWQRSRTQRKLFTTGELNAFDPFTEEEFFERGMHRPFGSDTVQPKRAFQRLIQDHVDARRGLNLEPLPYSRERLGELIKRKHDDDLKLGAEWMIRKYDVLAGDPDEQLKQLAERWNSGACQQRFRSTTLAAKIWVREQKRDFERVLDSLLQNNRYFRGPQIGFLLNLLATVKGHPEFSYARILSYELLATRPTGKAAAALGCHIVNESWPEDLRIKLRQRFSVHLGLPPNLFLGQGQMRQEVLRALATQHERQGMYARALIVELLKGASEHDRDQRTRDEATRLLSELN